MTYAANVSGYHAAGWRCIIPVPEHAKFPPPDGVTGERGIDEIDPSQIADWCINHPDHSIALRLPTGVIALDIDHYDKHSTLPDGSAKTVSKRGADTIRHYEQKWGPLPPTWSSTARPGEFASGQSRTVFYRVPPGRYASRLGDAVEVIQRHHRYCVVWPSRHSSVDEIYRWYAPTSQNARVLTIPAWRCPTPGELSELPAAWVTGLAEGAGSVAPIAARGNDGAALLAAVLSDDRKPCAEISNAQSIACRRFTEAAAGSRHDTATGWSYQVIRLSAFGHPGAGRVLAELAARWAELTAGEDRQSEWEQMCLSAACKAVTEIGDTAPVPRDPCAVWSHWRPPVPIAVGMDNGEPELIDYDPDHDCPTVAEPIPWSRRELIGTGLFDPPAGLDQLLAEATLERVHPVLRYTTDSGKWLLRGPFVWETKSDMSDWAITEVFGLMPRGDRDAEKNTPEWYRAERYKRFGSNGGSNAIAGKIRALVRATGHPCTVRMSDLDADPEIMWAGGLPWSLRQSLQQPALAAIASDTPHLESAGIPPSGEGTSHPTPYWDAYIESIWPDVEVREYALQVLAVAFTGYSDAVLPILWGMTGTGKTSLISLLMSVLGSYAGSADPRLLASMDNAHASIVYALKGKRLMFIDEGPRKGELATARLKQLTGGAKLTGNEMRANPIDFVPSHTLVLTCNPEETPTFADPALRRRVRLLPCDGDPIAVAAARSAISTARWHAEAPGVLAAMMHRAALWLADRSVADRSAAPASIRYRTEEIANEQDLIKAWIEAEMEPHPDGMRTAELLARCADWLRRFGLRAPGLTQFGRRLSEMGYWPVHQREGNFRPLRPRQGSGLGPYVPPPQTGRSGAAVPDPSTADPARHTGGSADAGKSDRNMGGQPLAEITRVSATSAEPLGQVSDTHHNESTESDLDYSVGEDPRSCEDLLPDLSVSPNQANTGIQAPPEDPGSSHTVKGVKGCEGLETNCSPRNVRFELGKQEIVNSVKGLELSGSPSYKLKNKEDITGQVPDSSHTVGRETGKTPPTLHTTLDTVDDQAIHREGWPNQTVHNPSPAFTPFTGHSDPQTRTGDEVSENELRALLATQRSERNDLTRRIRQAAKTAPQDLPELESARESTKQRIKGTEARLRAAVAAAKRAAAVTEAAGPVLTLPVLKVRGNPPVPIGLQEAAAAVREAVARDGGRCTVDMESTGFPIGHPDHGVRTVQLGDWWAGVVFDAGDPVQGALATQLLAEAPELQAYSAAVELSHLSHIGMLDFDRDWRRVHDVVIPAQLANPIGTLSSEAGLKEQSVLRMPDTAVSPEADSRRKELFAKAGWLTDTKIKGGGWVPLERSGWAQADPRCSTMADYAASDVLDTAALAHVLPVVPERVYARERAVQAAVAGVSYHGLRLDGRHIDHMIGQCEPPRDAAVAELRRMGIDNPASNDQIAAALTARGARLSMTDKGKLSVKADVLENLGKTQSTGPVIDQVLRFRHYNRQLSTYLCPYRLLVRHGDGRMRSVVYTLQADTGRMSSVHPNLQNIPRVGGIRECITADEGDLFIDADLTGVEVAVLAALSQDPNLIEIVHGPVKLHKIIANHVFGENNYSDEEYTYVKNGVFAKFYGATVQRIKDTVGCSLQIAQSMTSVLDEIAPVAREWGYQWRNAAKGGTTSYELYSGRVLHLPSRYPHKVVNYLIQATAREIFVDGLLRWAKTRWGKYKVTVPVHDEILSSVPADEAMEAQVELSRCMSTELYGVRIGAEAKWLRPSWHWLSNDADKVDYLSYRAA